MPRRHVVTLALAAESVVGLAGLVWIAARELPVTIGTSLYDLATGLAAGALLIVVNLGVVHAGPDVAPVRALRRLHRDVLEPLFGRFTPGQIVAVSLAAGAGEELLFRGAVQTEWGLVVASLLFGIVHIGGIDMIAFGVWAACVGALLGLLASATGGLLAPMTAHALYDALALVYIVRTSPHRGVSPSTSQEPPE